jgi:hypothetical protein
MLHRQLALDQVAPWLVSGASGCYIVARARRLSRAKASRVPWSRFLLNQSDMILMLFGSPAIWHLTRRRSPIQTAMRKGTGDRETISASVTHQLRQIFTVLLIGLGLIARRAAEGRPTELIALAHRLQNVVRTGAHVLAVLDDPYSDRLLTAEAVAYNVQVPGDGWQP